MPAEQHSHWVPPTTVDPAQLHTAHPSGYNYQEPTPNTETPGQLLISHYGDRSATRDWADLRNPNGVLRAQQETHRQQRGVLPIGSAGLVGDWPRPGGLKTVTVRPIIRGMPVTDSEEVVDFKNQDGKLGISMAGLFRGNWQCLVGPNDIVLGKFNSGDVTFVITWLGYEKRQARINTRLDNGDPMTRLNLAIQITMAYAEFFEKVDNDCVLPGKVGFYNIALHQGKDARKDSLGVQFTQLRLTKFYNTTEGYFVAEVDIV